MCHQCIKGTGIITFDRIMKKKGNITVPTGTTMKDMGRVMGLASKKMAGKADGRMISTVVKRLLS